MAVGLVRNALAKVRKKIPDMEAAAPPAPAAAPAPAAPPAANSDEGVQNTAMSRLAQGLAGPSQGLQTAIGTGRNAVAQFARDTQRQAANTAVKSGALGQGTQTALGQEARQSVMGKLVQNEGQNAQMVSNEGKAFMDKALEVGHQNKTLKQQQGQFDVTAGQEATKIANQASQFGVSAGQDQQRITNQASQFATTAGQSQQNIDNQKTQFGENLKLQRDELDNKIGQQATENMIALGGDIPTIAAKVMDGVLGKAGTPLTTEEKADLQKWYDEKKAKGEKLDTQMETLIDKMVKDSVNPDKTAKDVAGEARNTAMKAILDGSKPITSMTPADWTEVAGDPGMMQTLAQNNPQFKPTATVPKTKSAADWQKSGLAPGDVVMQDGKPMKIVEYKTEKYKNWTGNTRKRNFTVAIDLATNKQVRLGDTGEYDPD